MSPIPRPTEPIEMPGGPDSYPLLAVWLVAAVVVIGCVSNGPSVTPVVPVIRDDAASVVKTYSAGCADAFDSAALELDAGKDLPTVHDDLRDKLKAVRLSVWKPVDKRLEAVGGGEDPDLKEVAKLLRQIATEFRSVK